MSSFMVSNKTINKVLTLFDINDFVKWGCEDKQELGIKLVELNGEAVAQRYDEPVNEKAVSAYEWESVKCSRIEALKALHCLIYQCYEGKIPKTKEYKWLIEKQNEVAHQIIDELPEYDKAPWDSE